MQMMEILHLLSQILKRSQNQIDQKSIGEMRRLTEVVQHFILVMDISSV